MMKRHPTITAGTTLDLHVQWRMRKDLRANLAIGNLTNRQYWRWSDRLLAASSTVVDACTQPGRHVNLSVVMDF